MTQSNEWTVYTLKELFDRLIDEHDRRYEARFSAAENAVKAAFEASNTAIGKSETAQAAYNARSNEFRQALDDQNKMMLPRIEADGRLNAQRELIDRAMEQIVALQRGASWGTGGEATRDKLRSQSNWVIGIVVMSGLNLLGLLTALLYFIMGKH